MIIPLRTTYTDFVKEVDGVLTHFRIFDIPSHLFIYVNQEGCGVNLFNEQVEKAIGKECVSPGKKCIAYCNLVGKESVKK
jgi:hypothetical protein